MNYTFDSRGEFQVFIEASMEGGDFKKDIHKFTEILEWGLVSDEGIIFHIKDGRALPADWGWVEEGKIYLATNGLSHFGEGLIPTIYFIYSPKIGSDWRGSRTIWWVYAAMGSSWGVAKDENFVSSSIKSLTFPCWVTAYLELTPYDSILMNWINENPFEVKQ